MKGLKREESGSSKTLPSPYASSSPPNPQTSAKFVTFSFSLSPMADNLMDKVNALGERLKMSEVGRKMSEGMSSMSFKVKEFFNGPNQVDKLVEDATSESLDEPDWAMNLDLCDLINTDKVNSIDLIRGIKKRIQLKSPRVQYLSLVLLETIVKNCEKAFSEVAAERVLDDMVRLIDDPQTVVNNRNKALIMIEAWGESTSELRYLPVYEETYKSLKSRGIRFPGRDNESLAPIFTPPRSVSEAELDLPRRTQHEDIPVQSFTPEQTKEAFDVARNSIELLSTVLSSSPQQDVLQEEMNFLMFLVCTNVSLLKKNEQPRPSKTFFCYNIYCLIANRDQFQFAVLLNANVIMASYKGRVNRKLRGFLGFAFVLEPVRERHIVSAISGLQKYKSDDELTTTLVQQCRRSQTTVQRIVETAGDDEALLFEALNVNDEIQKVLSKYEDLRKPTVIPVPPEPAMIPVAVEPEESPRHAKEDALIRKPAGSRAAGHGGSNEDMMDDLDEMIFGKKGGDSSGGGHDTKKQQSSKDDLISF
ncbi:hypothetical protein Ahy_A05g024876 [Arachis hypogaea]|uniref:VHS domain-containing protein n=1 Tax=Arachis hypogaea TaxID=3818 RepID=A0A445D6X5_ARAHY|nr:hypothetical protein Ahy_A05g024876 [Arachis hypogaea]